MFTDTLPLGRAELIDSALALAADERAWRPAVQHDHERRMYVRLDTDEHSEAWLVCWMPGHDTGFHDHGGSAGVVVVLGGQIHEQRVGAENALFEAGEAFAFEPGDIHRVRHVGVLPATTLHVYSPPLGEMRAYEVGES